MHSPIYGAGQTVDPKVCLVFMNPTGKNVASDPSWKGLRAPWLGTKHVWKMLNRLGLFNNQDIVQQILSRKSNEWDNDFINKVYKEVEDESLYITNIGKCTQEDARPLPNSLFKEYLPSKLEELSIVNPKFIFTFGNQVSSILLQKPISVSNYQSYEKEELSLDDKVLSVYPTFYPVGQGMRNMPKAEKRIRSVLG